jgi:putative PIN family toxin of toxin-antitoxin system
VRAVVDANVWVSGVLARTSAPARLVAHFLGGRFELVTSEPLLAEVTDVLARPHIARRSRLSRPEIRLLIGAMRDLGDVVEVVGGVAVCRDPEDDAVIETAIRGNADVLISGDKDLTDAPEVSQALATAGIHVLTVARFVTELEGSIG